jgi:hypothetical protein
MREAAIRGTVAILGYVVLFAVLWGLGRGLWAIHAAYGLSALLPITGVGFVGLYLLARWLDIHHPRQPPP